MLIRFFRYLRKKYWYYKALRTLGGRKPDGIHVGGKVIFTNTTIIGKDCHFNGMRVEGKGEVTIGDHFHSGSEILIMTTNHNYDRGNAVPYDDTVINKNVVIGDNVWIGSRVIILPGTVIEDGVVVQAGSVCVGLLPYCSVCGGHPAKVIKYRDIFHYEKFAGKKN